MNTHSGTYSDTGSIVNGVFVLLSDSKILTLSKCANLNYHGWNHVDIYYKYHHGDREGKLKILNYILAWDSYPALEFSNSVSISTIIGFQILTELFMTWNGKMKSLAEFNINKKKYLKSFA